MKYLNRLKLTTKLLFIFLLGIISAQVTAPNCECGEPENIWFKISSETGEYKVVQLDMTKGKSFSDSEYIYIVVQDIETLEMIYVVFPNGGDWTAEVRDPFLDALEQEFKSLEDYLRATQGRGSEIKKKQ